MCIGCMLEGSVELLQATLKELDIEPKWLAAVQEKESALGDVPHTI